MNNLKELQQKLVEPQEVPERTQSEIKQAEDRCVHVFGEGVHDPIVIPAYTHPEYSDLDFPGNTHHWWRYTCSKCSKVRHTTLTPDEVKKTKAF